MPRELEGAEADIGSGSRLLAAARKSRPQAGKSFLQDVARILRALNLRHKLPQAGTKGRGFGYHTHWLETRSRWSKLRELGQSHLVRSSVLMPVFGYLLLLNENVHHYLIIQYDAGWPFNYLPTMWRVWMLFYGSFLLATGSILFAWRCPAEIKQYASPFSLVDAERPHLTAHSRTQQVADKLKALYSSMSTWESSIFVLPRLKPDLPNLGAGTSPDLQTSDQWGLGLIHIWTVNDIKCPRLRIITLFLFWAGLVLLAIPAGFTFLQVSLLLAKHVLVRI